MMKENLIKIYERSFIDNWELPALTDYNTGERMTYGDFARNIARLHMLFDGCGGKAGDRIALIGKNIPNWLTENVWKGMEFEEMTSCAKKWVKYLK